MNVIAKSGLYRFPFEETFKILIEERMQSANKAFWKDIKIYRNKDVPWRVICRRLVDHVYPVFCFGSENWSWTVETMNKIKRWEAKIMMRLFRFKKNDETWVAWNTRCCRTARKTWVHQGLPFLNGLIAENLWRAMGWTSGEGTNPVFLSLKKVLKWRSPTWWYNTHAKGIREDPRNHTMWKHKWGWHNFSESVGRDEHMRFS